MKKVSYYLMIAVMLLGIFPTTIIAAEKVKTAISTENEVPAEVKVMYNRLEEIKEMDKSNLSSSEKRELRKEVRTIKTELKSTGHGVYLSVGAIIIIVLLLILLL